MTGSAQSLSPASLKTTYPQKKRKGMTAQKQADAVCGRK